MILNQRVGTCRLSLDHLIASPEGLCRLVRVERGILRPLAGAKLPLRVGRSRVIAIGISVWRVALYRGCVRVSRWMPSHFVISDGGETGPSRPSYPVLLSVRQGLFISERFLSGEKPLLGLPPVRASYLSALRSRRGRSPRNLTGFFAAVAIRLLLRYPASGLANLADRVPADGVACARHIESAMPNLSRTS